MAYALISFIQILKQYEHASTPDIKSLLDKACRLRTLVEVSYGNGGTVDLEDQIRDAAHMAEDIIEIGFTDHFSDQSTHFNNLESALRAFDSISHQMSEIQDKSTEVQSDPPLQGKGKGVSAWIAAGIPRIEIQSDRPSPGKGKGKDVSAWMPLTEIQSDGQVKGNDVSARMPRKIPNEPLSLEREFIYKFRGIRPVIGRHLDQERATKIINWDLIRGKVFGQEHCPPELESIGIKIAEGCEGLPMATTLVAGLLSVSQRTKRFWKLVERKVNSLTPFLDKPGNVVLMCYNYLPYYLKPCFLYLGAFPVDHEIRASKIINLWIAEGFVAPAHDNILEETAERHLADLAGRNLLVVSQKDTDGKVKGFQMDDFVREFCQKKAREEKLLRFECSDGSSNIPEEKENTRRVSFNLLSKSIDNMTSMPLARSFLCFGHASLHLAPMFFAMKLLRVLDVFQLEFQQFPKEILQLVLLRYLAFSCHSDLPSSIAKLRYLQSLIIRRLPSCRAFSLPPALWNSTELRHIKSKETCIWLFPGDDESFFLENLQTLSNIHAFLLTQKFLASIKNIRKLGIFFNESSRTLPDHDLSSLLKLQTLKCSSSLSDVSCDRLLCLSFPPLLKKLTLSSCKIPGALMRVVGSLSHLEQLKLQKCDMLGIELKSVTDDSSDSESELMEPEWSLVEGEFPQLRSLVMEELDLVHWKANQTHFSSLERLVIRRCYSMRGIPLVIGYINTLRLIEVDESNPSVLDSAQVIRDGVQAIGQGVVKLHVSDHRHSDVN